LFLAFIVFAAAWRNKDVCCEFIERNTLKATIIDTHLIYTRNNREGLICQSINQSINQSNSYFTI